LRINKDARYNLSQKSFTKFKLIKERLIMEYLKQFQIHLSNNNLPQVVNLWQEYCLSEEIDSEEFKQILTEIKESHLAESFGCYADQGLLLWEQMDPDENKDAIFKLIFDIQTSNAPHLAELALNYILEKYKTDPLLTQKIKLVGLREKTSFKNAISNFELLTHMKVGNFFIHTGGWGVGEVIEISMIREQISLEFDYVAGHKELSFVNAFKTLIPITKDHFLARRFGDPEAFEAFAKENPVETIHLLLKNLGPKTASEIKDELEVLVIPEKDWQRWWQTTRTRLKKDTFIEAPKSIRDTFKLRKTEITHEERLAKALGTSPDANTLIEMIYTFMRDFPQALKNPEFAQTLKDQLSEVLFHKEISASQEIQILFILQDLGHEKAKNVPEIISKMNNIEDIVNEIHVLAYKKRMLMEVKKNRDDWPTHFSNLILLVDQNPLRDYLLDTLLSNTQQGLVEEKINEILDTPNISPQAFLWYFQKIMNNEKYPLSDQNGKDRFFESFFILLHMIEMKPNYRDMVKKMHNFLSSGRFSNVRKIFKDSTIEMIKEILLLSTKCQTLSDHDVKILHSLAEVVYPELSRLRKSSMEDEPEVIIWTTENGYKKVQERIERIGTVEIIENAKEIEIARSHGDLRENSEYKFAQEKRARLQSEMRFLSNQIKSMRILTKEDIDLGQVGIGCVVKLQDNSGKETSYTFLGPWDADPEHNILSIESKIGKDLTGLKIDDHCTIKEQDWKLVSISSFL